jgi:thiamine transporter ThiT
LRERRHFWESRPSRTLALAVVLDILAVAAISALGFFQLQAIPLLEIAVVLGFSAAVAFGINDPVKVVLVRKIWT